MRGRRGYGGFLGPVINSIINALAREILIILGLKKRYRGGLRITTPRNIVQGKDKYGRRKKREG
jgi:hypothetical protein